MPKQSAGLLAYRIRSNSVEVFLVHPGGPFWAKKDAGVWSIPKGEFDESEEPQEAARREFFEETGVQVTGEFFFLGSLRQPGGKLVHAWAIQVDIDPTLINSNTFSMEWPPKSGQHKEFPEADRAGWFTRDEAMQKILRGQQGFVTRLLEMLQKARE